MCSGLVDFDTVIVRFGGEMGIKGEWTRRRYERLLLNNIKRTLNHYGLEYGEIIKTSGRIYIKTTMAVETAQKLTRMFGVSSTSPAVETTSKMNYIRDKCLYLAARSLGKGDSFAVRCRRVGTHPYTSMEVCQFVGREILEGLPELDLRVNLENPSAEIHIEIRDERAFVFSDILRGVGGFPLGSQPRLVCLLSGGIDSPVACWLVMKRGAPITPVYFDNEPFTDESTLQRAIGTAKMLFEWAVGFSRKLYVVPHGPNLVEIREKCPEKLTCVLCKRMMYRIAEKVAEKVKAEGIVAGESIGEQASQTLQNLRVINEAAKRYPVHRPLIGLNKTEIETLAKRIGTYEVSIQKAARCTAVPRKPATRVSLENVLEAEKALDIEGMIERSVENMKVLSL